MMRNLAANSELSWKSMPSIFQYVCISERPTVPGTPEEKILEKKGLRDELLSIKKLVKKSKTMALG